MSKREEYVAVSDVPFAQCRQCVSRKGATERTLKIGILDNRDFCLRIPFGVRAFKGQRLFRRNELRTNGWRCGPRSQITTVTRNTPCDRARHSNDCNGGEGVERGLYTRKERLANTLDFGLHRTPSHSTQRI